jgi:hypothetical protein
MKLKFLLLSAFAASAVSAFAADVIVSGQITANTTWTANNRYQLQGKVYVVNGATLTIEPGTVIQGRVSSGNDAAALVITRGSKINADGTASRPIIFTSELDQLNGNLTARDVGLWGGVVILGNAVINSRADSAVVPAPIEDQVEGIVLTGADAALTRFGGTNDDDNSGVFRYVSIRHGGAIVGTANELNGLTLGGVGRGTTVEFVEVFANRDDGIEWFGGTVNGKYLISAFCGDDAFDYDQGYRGNLQFLFGIQADNRQSDSDDGYLGDKGFEFDGATAPEATATPLGGGTVFNATLIGIGTYTRPNGAAGAANVAMHLRDNGAHKIYNSVFVDYANFFQVDSDEAPRIADGGLVFASNTFFSHVAANNAVNATGGAGVFASGSNLRPEAFTTGGNQNVNPQLRGISRSANRGLDPRPAAGSPALIAVTTTPTNPFFTNAGYRGAFSSTNWAAGWSKLWTDGFFSLDSVGEPGTGDTPIISGSANKFINISTLGTTSATGQVLTAGFVIPAGQAQTVIIRGVGPGLTPLGVAGALADPVLEVYRAGATQPFVTNDNWSGTQIATVSASVGAFALPNGSADAAVILNLQPGGYTVQVKGKGTASGTAIVEVYEVD